MPLLQELFEKKVPFKGGHADIMKSSEGGRDIDTPSVDIQEQIQNIHDNAWRYIRSGKRPPVDLVEKLTELKTLHMNPEEAQRRRIKLSSSEFSLLKPSTWFGGGKDEGGNSEVSLSTPLATDRPEDLDRPTTVDPREFNPVSHAHIRDDRNHSTQEGVWILKGAYPNTYDDQLVRTAFGVVPGAKITVSRAADMRGGLLIDSQTKGTDVYLRAMPGKEVYLENLDIGKESEYRGRGAELVRNQLVALSRLGHREMNLLAAGDGARSKQYQNPLVGYYFWLKMGFSGQADDRTMALLRDKFGVKYNDLQDFATQVPGFMEYWKDHGKSWNGKFILHPSSKNWNALAHHIQQKQMKGRQ